VAGTLCRSGPLHYNGTLRSVVTAREVPASGELRVAAGAIVTPSARDLAAERGVKIVEGAAAERTVALGPITAASK